MCLRKMPDAVSHYRTWGPTLGREGQEGQLWLHRLQGPFILSTLARNFPTPILYHHLLYLYWGRDILYSSSAYTEVNGITHILLESLKKMWLVGISGESPTGCYCHPGQLPSFSGNLLHCFATITPQESFPLKLKPCFIPYKHAGQIFPFICATVYHKVLFFHLFFLLLFFFIIFLGLRNPSYFALPSEVLFPPALLLVAPWSLPIFPVLFWNSSCTGTQRNNALVIWKPILQQHKLYFPEYMGAGSRCCRYPISHLMEE